MTKRWNYNEIHESDPRVMYKSDPSSMPRWMKRCTSNYGRRADRNGFVAELGFELKPNSCEYTTCVKVTYYRTVTRR